MTTSRHVEVLLSVESTIFTVDNLECIDQVRHTSRRESHKPKSPLATRTWSVQPHCPFTQWEIIGFDDYRWNPLGSLFRLSEESG